MAKLPIAPRQPGETEEDYRRRYHREKMRLRRAALPKSNRKRGKGKGPSKLGKLTQEEWEALQPQPGETAEEHRRRYNRAATQRHRETHSERLAVERRAAYAANPEPERERKRRIHAAHPERQREYDRRHDVKNPGKRAAAAARWAKANPEKQRAMKQRWNDANRALLASYSAKWRKAARMATPAWADFDAIRAFYEEARRLTEETGIPHHVDHIVPLQSKLVCGLHAQANLRVVTDSENVKKRNRVDYALIYSMYGCDARGRTEETDHGETAGKRLSDGARKAA